MSPTTGTAEFFRVNVLLLSRNSLYGNEFRLCVNTDRWKESASQLEGRGTVIVI